MAACAGRVRSRHRPAHPCRRGHCRHSAGGAAHGAAQHPAGCGRGATDPSRRPARCADGLLQSRAGRAGAPGGPRRTA
ncbi:hypothetical protein IP84_02710 [beta proteobacterium AAP99]|nr:hypothetical protein IP84_02710 [beta proteobacterium AAP99]